MASMLELWLLAQTNYLQNNTPQKIGSTTLALTTASITITVPTTPTFSALRGEWGARGDAASAAISIGIRFNADAGNNYLWQQNQTNNATATASNSGGLTSVIQVGAAPANTATANFFGAGSFTVANPGGAIFKAVAGASQAQITTSNSYVGVYGGQWDNTAAITSATLLVAAGGGNLVAGSVFTLYGIP